jgi:hypothetical protein
MAYFLVLDILYFVAVLKVIKDHNDRKENDQLQGATL